VLFGSETFIETDQQMSAKIAYFVHDLTDPTFHRRMQMLIAGGATVTPIGFRRSLTRLQSVQGMAAVDLGRTMDGQLTRRVLSVGRALAKIQSIEKHVRGSDVILARNLEMLVIAARARKLYAANATLVYESLDIHSLLLSRHPAGGVLRLIESKLWRDVDLLLTSSPAFVRNYFLPRRFSGPIRIEENKVLVLEDGVPGPPPFRKASGPPWRIGWFGMIRCRKSLEVLSSLARAADGAVEIIIRGRPSDLAFPDFKAVLNGFRNVHYLGPYRNPDDLARIYGEVHFSWAIDYYEKGLNSAWLLPCRMYEGSLYGSVPIAEKGVETANWLLHRGAGVIIDEPVEGRLLEIFRKLNQTDYSELVERNGALSRQDLVIDRADCRTLVEALRRPRVPDSVMNTV
jgi:succinoglycan biosynthesis protein ExoL